MLITFNREGYANNSSSSHSIIFSQQLSKTHTDDYEANSFQWDNFTLTSRYAKESYLLTQWLMNVYDRHADTHVKKIIVLLNELKNNERTNNIFQNIDRYYESIYDEDNNEDNLNWYSSNMSVDHQSVITWPINVLTQEYDVEFFLDFSEEILEKEYVILGGNDNSNDHPLKPGEGAVILKENFIEFYESLVEAGTLYSIKDKKTNEWILSSSSMGWLKKFIFDNDLVKNKINLNDPTVFFNGDNLNDNKLQKSGFPYLIDMKISSFCSFGCKFCYTSSTTEGEHGDADFIINQIIPVLKSAGVMEIVLGGGEPTFHPRFLDILKALKQNNFKIGFTSKNYNLHKHPDIEEILNNTNSIAFSINSLQDVLDLQPFLYDISTVRERTTRQNPTIYAQLILGLEEWDKTLDVVKALIKKEDKSIHNITFLGLKRFGFGTDYVNKIDNNEWINDIKLIAKNQHIDFGVDSVIANKYKDVLVNEHRIAYNRLTGAEGKQTCYIDAVDKKIAASSFIKNCLDFSSPSLESFLNQYSTF